MISTSLCFGYWAECPQHCHRDEPEENNKKCFVWRQCFKDWYDYGGRLGLEDILKDTVL